MGEEQLLELLHQAQEALDRGDYTYNEVNEVIHTATEGQFPGLMSLRLAVDPQIAAEEQEREALETAAEHSPASNFMRAFAQGATFGFADELAGVGAALVPGGRGYEEATAASRERIEALREANPGATLAAEGAGMFFTGLGAGAPAFSALRGAGGVLRTAGAGAVVGAGEGAAVGAGEAEGDLIERAPAAGRGAAGAGAFGLLLGGGGAFAGRVGRTLASPTRSVARREAQDLMNMAGMPDVGDVRGALQRSPAGTTISELDPALRASTPGVVRQAPSLRRGGGPIDKLRVRLDPKQIESARRAIWKPLEKTAIPSKKVAAALRNPEALDATSRVFKPLKPGEFPQKIRFRQLQDIRQLMKRNVEKAARDQLPDQFRRHKQALERFDDALDTAVPGYRQARRRYADLITRQDDFDRLMTSIERAVPTFNPDVPSYSLSNIRNVIFNVEGRRTQVAEMVGEILLRDGEEGIELLEDLIRRGFFAKSAGAFGRGSRQTAQTEIGRRFGGTVEEEAPRPSGLLGGFEADASSTSGLLLGGSY